MPNFNYRLEYLFLNCFFLSANFRRVRKTAKSDNYIFHVSLSVRPSFHEILYMMISLKYVGEIQVSFKSDKHNECFT